MHSTHPTRRHLLALGAAAFTAPFAGTARAQTGWPDKPIKIIVAYSAGGDTDVLARVFGKELSARIHQPVLVENRTGASGMIGTSWSRTPHPTATRCCWRPTPWPSPRWC
jgi:tripartite-type tricarboxylate transporter receptor subunit TctC